MATPRPRLALLAALAVLLVGATLWFAFRSGRPTTDARPDGPRELVATMRTEPASFNHFAGVVADPTLLFTFLTQAGLVRVNRETDQLEPWLAESWEASPDGLEYDIRLREGVRFSDGEPFSAADVEFSFAAAFHPSTVGPFADALRIGGKPLELRVASPSRVIVRFPEPYGPGLRVLDLLPIYPRHRLAAALEAGTFSKAWGPTTPPGEIVGLGPFRLDRYEPGQRMVFVRQPHYWRRDDDGSPLPKLDRLTVEIVPDQNAELLRIQAGHSDLMHGEVRPDDYVALKAAADAGRIKLIDVGLSPNTHLLWFNLTPTAARDGRGWWLKHEFRLALSHAVDRRKFADTVYLGAARPAWGIVGQANRTWFAADVAEPAFDRAKARRLLAAAGLRDSDGDGRLEDASGAPVRFTILVQQGVTAGENGAAFLREELAQVGVAVDVAALELGAVIDRWSRGDYDAIFHLMVATDTDPAGNLDFWLSSGSSHMWNPGQKAPATEWEGRIDALMRRQVASTDAAERRRLFAEVQQILTEHAPVLVFAAPHVYIATSPRVAGITPVVHRPQVLWNPDRITVAER